jgi:NAD(P)H-hydrate epimerase
MPIPYLSTQQMIEVDRLMVEEYSIQLVQMMENAGRNLADLSRRLLGGEAHSRRIAILCGTGNNGGGGMVAARHLHNWGAEVSVKLIGDESHLKIVPAHQFQIIQKMGIPIRETFDLNTADLILDAMIGYGLSGDPRGVTAEWIRHANEAGRRVLALDTPSGLNATTGTPGNPCLRATATMTLALPKLGLAAPEATAYVGKLYLADISVPPELYAGLGIEVTPLFIHDPIIEI